MCGVQAAADRVGQPWDVVESPLASESEPEGRVEANTTPISRKPTTFLSTTTIEFCDPREVGVLSVRAELVRGTLQLTIITRMETLGDCSAQDVIQDWLDSWTTLQHSDGQSDT